MPASVHDLVLDHLYLVRAIAIKLRRTYGLTMDVDELVSYGWLGLVEAAHRFDPDRGSTFAAFAYARVRGTIIDGVGTLGPTGRRRAGEREPVRGDYLHSAVPCTRERADQSLARRQEQSRVQAALARLPARSRYLVERRYWDRQPLGEIGRELGLSKSRASRIHSAALATLRSQLGDTLPWAA